MKIKVPHFDNTALVQGYSKTLIGRCMNPRAQNMNNLLFMLPRIWNVEERVAGITLWVRVLGVPLHFWVELTFRTIGGAIGEVKAVDIDSGMVQVVLNGFKSLCFKTSVEFHSGEEISITLRYERLYGFCRKCFSLCHDEKECAELTQGGGGNDGPPGDSDMGARMLSYKGAVDNKRNQSQEGGNAAPKGNQQGKRQMVESYDEAENRRHQREARPYRNREGRRVGGEGSRANRNHESYQRYDRRYRVLGSGTEVGNHEVLPLPVASQIQAQAVDACSDKTNAAMPGSGKKGA